MKGIEDKVIVIAGGGSGIGAATARRLASEGAHVLIGDINLANAETTASEIQADGGRAIAVACDISDEPSCSAMIQTANDNWGRLDGLFNVAADLSQENLGRDGDVVTVPLEVLEHTLKVNVMGYFHTVRHAIPLMLESGGGSIVNTTSGVVLGAPRFSAYGASKGSVIALSRHIARAYGKQGIRSNALDPGVVLTSNQLESNSDEERAAILQMATSDRFAQPDETAAMVTFLLSDEAPCINGQTIVANSMDGAR